MRYSLETYAPFVVVVPTLARCGCGRRKGRRWTELHGHEERSPVRYSLVTDDCCHGPTIDVAAVVGGRDADG